jgi:hypothetical protein
VVPRSERRPVLQGVGDRRLPRFARTIADQEEGRVTVRPDEPILHISLPVRDLGEARRF